MAAQGRYGGRKVREGTVVSDKMAKTVVVAVEANLRHPLYKKIVRRVRRYMADSEGDDCHLGDRVRIVEARPLSRRKRWRVAEVLVRAELPEVAPEAIDLELLGEVKAEEEAPAETEAAAAAAEEVAAGEPPVVEEPAAAEPAAEAEPEAEAAAVEEETTVEAPPPEEEAAAEEPTAEAEGDEGSAAEAAEAGEPAVEAEGEEERQ